MPLAHVLGRPEHRACLLLVRELEHHKGQGHAGVLKGVGRESLSAKGTWAEA